MRVFFLFFAASVRMENFSVLKIVVNASQSSVFSASAESNHIIYYM